MDIIKKYVDKFNGEDEELYVNLIDNAHAYEWLSDEIPVFECPDEDIEKAYYFRWWTYRKHLKKTEDGYIISEFLQKVSWSGKHNEINAAVGHHLYEGRWLKNSGKYLKDYINFFLNNPERGHQYSAWFIYAVHQMCMVNGEWNMGADFLEKICRYYEEWEKTHLLPNGMYWSYDNYDAMEYMVSGTTEDLRCLKGIRPTLNSYMCADAWAIADFARRMGKKDIEEKYLKKYELLKEAINKNLWQDGFYRAFHFEDNAEGSTVESIIENWRDKSPKELIGYIPWMFNIPDEKRESVFEYLTDENFFSTEFGLATLEKNNKRFLYEVDHECLWNGYVWPFATAQTLTAMRNMIVNCSDREKYKDSFFKLCKQYAKSHKRVAENGKIVNWIDEVRHPLKDEWSSREILKNLDWMKDIGGMPERGKDYNHSTFCDIVISGIAGVIYEKDELMLMPMIPEDWEWFRVENLHIRGEKYSVIYDKTGDKYNCGKGLMIRMIG